MFTGLIESVGEVADVSAIDGGFRTRASRRDLAARFASGRERRRERRLPDGRRDAAGGICSAEIGPETAKVTSLGGLHAGSLVNLERAMRGRRPVRRPFGARARRRHRHVQAIRPEAEFSWVTVGYPAALAPYLIHRGSIAVDGISLTVAKLEAATLRRADRAVHLGAYEPAQPRAGDRVNLECDMVGKYVLARASDSLMGTKI